MDQFIFKKAKVTDIDRVLELIQKRIDWMDKQNINQWNKTNYLECYPKQYFEEMVFNGQFYVMKEAVANRVVGAVALLEKDSRWKDDLQSCYIHNLVSDTAFAGVGARMIHNCEKIAMENGKNKIRLDCQSSNHKLNNYYEQLGYKYVGIVRDGHYIGNKREKRLEGFS